MRVFISYSHQDRVVVDKIVERLKRAGHDVWLDRLKLKSGDNISEKIERGIRQAEAIIVVVSNNYMNSPWAQKEISILALSEISSQETRIYPVLLDDSTVPTYLSSFLYVNLSKDFEGGLSQLISSIGSREVGEPREAQQRSAQAASRRDSQLSNLATALRAGRLTLVCGAGVSVGAGIPAWNDLLVGLLESVVERLSKEKSLDLGAEAAAEFNKRHGASSLIVGKYLKNSLGDDFNKKVRFVLYKGKPSTCDLIDSIVDLARPQREGRPLDSIVTFNFDDLLERNLLKSNISISPISSEHTKHDVAELPIYHVHGYLPRSGKAAETSEIVFSEDSYHSQFIDPFSWSNLIQLNKYSHNTCLFVGIRVGLKTT